MEPIDTETVETDAGEYVIAWHTDECPDAPYNEGLGFAFDGGRRRIDVAAGDHATEVLAILQANLPSNWLHTGQAIYPYSSAGIARYLRIKYGLIGIRVVDYDYQTSTPTPDRERIYGIAWAPSDALGPNGPDGYTDVAIAEYRAWAQGDCFGYTVTDPSGNEIDSCWGFYGYHEQRDWTREQALAAVKNDADERGKKCNLVGAGIVGII